MAATKPETPWMMRLVPDPDVEKSCKSQLYGIQFRSNGQQVLFLVSETPDSRMGARPAEGAGK
jgi:hypothetical protein